MKDRFNLENESFPHNQGIPGSSPGGVTEITPKNERVTEEIFCGFFILEILHSFPKNRKYWHPIRSNFY